eukprot:1440280-Alexandrium_andersonii.AAC.1
MTCSRVIWRPWLATYTAPTAWQLQAMTGSERALHFALPTLAYLPHVGHRKLGHEEPVLTGLPRAWISEPHAEGQKNV